MFIGFQFISIYRNNVLKVWFDWEQCLKCLIWFQFSGTMFIRFDVPINVSLFVLSGTMFKRLQFSETCLKFFIWFQFSGTMFILGGCMLHLCVSGALYRPLHVHVIVTRNERRRKQKLEEQVQLLRYFCVTVIFCVTFAYGVTFASPETKYRKKDHLCVNLVVTSILPHLKRQKKQKIK